MRRMLLNQRGITLIEMMVAITVGLILLAGIVELFVTNKQAYRIQEGTNVLNENARYALNQIEYSLRLADHWGGVKGPDLTVDPGIAAIPLNCAASPVLSGTGITGFDGTSANSPLSCIPNADYQANTDMIVLRYASPPQFSLRNIPAASIVPLSKQIMVRTAIGRRGMIYQAEDAAALFANGAGSIQDLRDQTNTEAPDYISNQRFNFEVYFIRQCSSQDRGTANVCDGQDDAIPTLTRLVLDTDGATLVQQDIIAGVEQMQVSYGLDTNGDLTADQYQNAATITDANNWDKVVDVRLSLILRNLERDQTMPPDTNTYRLYGGAAGAGETYTAPVAVQKFRRKLINSSIQVRNLIRG
ncbi:MAG: PilW family protein [Gammaproteobacteria bacterium]|nr:PilW family protein [Gammaproteobacteria bacterium]